MLFGEQPNTLWFENWALEFIYEMDRRLRNLNYLRQDDSIGNEVLLIHAEKIIIEEPHWLLKSIFGLSVPPKKHGQNVYESQRW